MKHDVPSPPTDPGLTSLPPAAKAGDKTIKKFRPEKEGMIIH